MHSPEGAAIRALQLMADPALREGMGRNGHLHVRQNFLLTRQIKDYLLVMLALEHPNEDIIQLN